MTRFSRQEFLAAVANGRVPQLAECSVDDGRTWTTAAAASKWVELKRGSDAGLSLIVPVAVEPRSVIAGYFALGSFFFFGGPASFVALVMALDTGPKLLVRVGALLVGFVLGPLPVAAVGWWALRAHLADSSKRGAGRAWFALVVAALLTLTLLGGVAGLCLRQP